MIRIIQLQTFVVHSLFFNLSKWMSKAQMGIPTVNKLMNQLMTSPWTTSSTTHAMCSYSLLLRISITIMSTKPIQRLAMRNSNDATIAMFTIQIAKSGNFSLITSIDRLMNFTSLSCCYGSFCGFITFTLRPNSSTVSSLWWVVNWLDFWFLLMAELVLCFICDLSTYDLLLRFISVSM